MKVFTCFFIVFFFSVFTFSQDLERQHSFAKSYFGLDFNFVDQYGSSSYVNEKGLVTSFDRSGYTSSAFNIGATHFWGHADLYVSINAFQFMQEENSVETKTKFGVFTGFRIYPFELKDRALRPYIGYKFSPFRYNQESLNGAAFKKTKIKSVFDVGLGYQLPNFYFYAGYNYIFKPELEIYISRTQKARTIVPDGFINVGMNWTFEATKKSTTLMHQKLSSQFSNSNRNGFFMGIGPSTAMQIVSSSYIKDMRPYLDNKPIAAIFPDFALGYHFTKNDFAVALSYRPISQLREAFDFSLMTKRKSFVLEGYKFLWDYQGFVPFIGGGVSLENLKIAEIDRGNLITDRKAFGLTPIIIFGWDIRPNNKSDWWILRTNLRYAPSLKINHKNKRISQQQLEFNFIQFVFYPQRYRKHRKDRIIN